MAQSRYQDGAAQWEAQGRLDKALTLYCCALPRRPEIESVPDFIWQAGPPGGEEDMLYDRAPRGERRRRG
jgi:hypothetical protein